MGKPKQKLNNAKQSQLILPLPLSLLCSVPNTASRRSAMAIAASCCSWCVPFQPPMWAPITVSAQTRWDVPRARCGYTVRMRNLLAAILAGSSPLLPLLLLLLLLFCFVLFFAEIKLHPGASSSNDEHSNFIGGKREIFSLCSAPSLHFLPLSLACRSRGGGTQCGQQARHMAGAAPAAAPAAVGVAAQHSVISKLSESRQSRNIFLQVLPRYP